MRSNRRYGHWLAVIPLLLFSLFGWALTPVQSPNDDRDYRYFTLENGLQVLLISDPEAQKGAAALDIRIGSGEDPEDRPGMAHFLEHMLFLGTEKYPDPGAYQRFISNHGGSHNAMTSFQHTNYFFDVDAPFLEPALDRFAQQFSAPLFNAELVDRERNAVHSEYSSKLKDDGRRLYAALKQALNPDHPYSDFAVGNLETLSNENGALREDLLRFYREHYSAHLMTLVVSGPQPLETLEAWVRERFSAIPRREVKETRHQTPLVQEETLPKLLRVQSLQEMRRLELTFPIPSTRAQYATKPAYFLSNLIGHEGPGSLLDLLKREGLAESLAAGKQMDTGQHALFSISISLTPQGLEEWEKVVDLSFDYIALIRSEGIQEAYYAEQRRLAAIDFRFKEQSDPVHEASRLARTLQRVAPRDVLQAPYMMTAFDRKAIRQLLERIRPANALITLASPQPLENARSAPYYDTPYQLVRLDPAKLTRKNTPLAARLALPDPNPFVPEDLALLDAPDMEHPVQLQDKPFALWYARDTRFGTPKTQAFISLRSPAANGSPRNRALTRLLVNALNHQLNAHAYAARLAGLDYAVYDHLRGITLHVGGYDDKLHRLLQRILLAVANPELSREQFRIDRNALAEKLQNATLDKPYIQAMGRVASQLVDDIWPESKELEAVRQLRFEDLQQFARQFRKELDPVMLVTGNTSRAGALNLAALAQQLVLDQARRVTVPRSKVDPLPPATRELRFTVDHPDTGYVHYLQGRDDSYAEQARYMLASQWLGAPFYQSLRTEKQLGYIVMGRYFPLLETPGLAFVVQSPSATGERLENEVASFVEAFSTRLSSLTDAQFEQQRQAVITRLSEKDKTLARLARRYWHEIDRGNRDFDTRASLIEAVRSLPRNALEAFYRDQIAPMKRGLEVFATPEVPDASKQESSSEAGASGQSTHQETET